MNGALTFKPDVLAKRLDDKATNLVWDALADPKLNPSSGPEAKADKRYRDGFKDIVSNHFLKKTEQKCVIVLVSTAMEYRRLSRLTAPACKWLTLATALRLQFSWRRWPASNSCLDIP